MRLRLWLSLSLLVGTTGCTGLVLGPEEGWLEGDAGALGPDASAPIGFEPDATPPNDPLASGVLIREVSILQTVAVPLARDGAEVVQRNAPVIAGADALLAIHVDIDGSFSPRPIHARVTLDDEEYTAETTISASSTDNPATALLVPIPGEAITTTSQFEVALHEAPGSAPVGPAHAEARYPAEGSVDLRAVSPHGPLHLVVVPFRYNADGSGRLPPTDQAAAAYYEAFKAIFPVADVQLTVRQPVNMDMSLATSEGWSQWLSLLRAVREFDDPPNNTYYYGISAPASTFRGYCNGGCIAGLGHVPSASNSFLFASVGVSFQDNLGVGTAVHEVGHTMGRLHAPCGGPSGIDSSYPYEGASIGAWGYDARRGEFKSPSQFTDVMGYCRSQWISDYQYTSVFNRISAVNAMSASFVPSAPTTYRVGLVDAEGEIEWERYATLDAPPTGGEIQVALHSEAGSELGVADAHFFPYTHLPGGVLYMPVHDEQAPAAVAPSGVTLAR
jgi:hypothetical protein